MRTRIVWLAGLSSLVLLALAAGANANEGDVAGKFQALFFKKLYGYTKASQTGRPLKICVAYEAEFAGSAETMLKEFEAAGVTAFTTKIEELPADLKQSSAIYVLARKMPASVKELVAKHSVLSASGIPALAEQGDVAVGMGVKDNKPDIVVHLGRLKQENQEIAAALLTMMRVIR